MLQDAVASVWQAYAPNSKSFLLMYYTSLIVLHFLYGVSNDTPKVLDTELHPIVFCSYPVGLWYSKQLHILLNLTSLDIVMDCTVCPQ